MKTLTTILIAAAVATPLALAASPYGDRPCSPRNSASFTETLGLSPDQSREVEAIFAEQKQRREAQRAERRAQREANQQAMLERMSEVLSPEQLATYKAMRAERQEWREKRHEERAEWREHHGYGKNYRDDD